MIVCLLRSLCKRLRQFDLYNSLYYNEAISRAPNNDNGDMKARRSHKEHDTKASLPISTLVRACTRRIKPIVPSKPVGAI